MDLTVSAKILLHGKPHIAWSIIGALQSNLFTDVWVTTDDDEIAEISESYGAKVICRPKYLADDLSRVDQVFYHHLVDTTLKLRSHEFMFCLYPTAPLRSSKDLQAMNELLLQNPTAAGVVAVTKFSHYPFQAMYIDANNHLQAMWPDHLLKKGNDFPELFAGNGSTYAIRVLDFLNHKNFLPLDSGLLPYVMEASASIDIDTKQDYDLLSKITCLGTDDQLRLI